MPPYDLIASIRNENVFLDVEAEDKERLLRGIAARVAERRAGMPPGTILEKLEDRERVMSTGIGNHVAVPHVTLEELDASEVYLFLLRDPVDFQAIDGQDVRVVFLLMVRPDDIAFHLQGLATIARIARHAGIAEELAAAPTRERVLEILHEKEPTAARK